MADQKGVVYMRTTRAATPVVYGPDESFPIGGSKVLKSSGSDKVTIVAAGITIPEALAAADELGAAGIATRVIDLYSVKPVDVATLQAAATETGGIVVVEDHWAEGGLGSAVLEGLASTGSPLPKVRLLGVSKLPGSGTPAELMDACGISARHIVEAARALVG
jgi:transketolase